VLIRRALEKIRKKIAKDEYLCNIPSVKKSLLAFHATDDCPEVREKVFKAIDSLPFKAEFIVARKIEKVFIDRHDKKPNVFYDDLINKLFQNHLHKGDKIVIYFSTRTNRARQAPFEDAVRVATLAFETKWKVRACSDIKIFPQKPEGEACLQVIDYMNWAIQRAFIKKDMRYFNFMKRKISFLVDVYDFENYPNNIYSRKKPFDIKKISPL